MLFISLCRSRFPSDTIFLLPKGFPLTFLLVEVFQGWNVFVFVYLHFWKIHLLCPESKWAFFSSLIFFFTHLKMLFHCLLIWMVPMKNQLLCLSLFLGTYLSFSSLAAPWLVLNIVITLYLDAGSFMLFELEVCSDSWVCRYTVFIEFEKFVPTIFSKMFSPNLSSSVTPIMHN